MNNSVITDLPAEKGVWAPIVTPVNQQGEIDHGRLLEHVRWLLANGCHGIVVWGSTSEAPSFSTAERMQVLQSIVDSKAAPPNQIIVGTGLSALPETVALSRHAIELGCVNLLVVPPFYFKSISDRGLAEYYSELIEDVAAAEMKLFFYHFPAMSAIPISHELIATIQQRFPAQVAGVKDSSGDGSHTVSLIETFPDLIIFPGSETLMLETQPMGGAGCISASANINPHGIRWTFDAIENSDDQLETFNDHMVAVRQALQHYPLAAACKAMLAYYRRNPKLAAVRPPLCPLDEHESKSLIEALEKLDFTLPE